MPYGKGTYGSKVGRPAKSKKKPNAQTGKASLPIKSTKTKKGMK